MSRRPHYISPGPPTNVDEYLQQIEDMRLVERRLLNRFEKLNGKATDARNALAAHRRRMRRLDIDWKIK